MGATGTPAASNSDSHVSRGFSVGFMADNPSGGAGFPAHALYTDTGVLIAVVRAGHGLTRRALADRAHVSYALLTKVEAGVEPASPELIAACAEALGVDSSLFTGAFRPDVHGSLLSAMAARASATQDVLDLPADEGVCPRPLSDLAVDVRRIGRLTQDGRFDAASAVLPRLLAELRITARTLTGPDQQTAVRLVSEAEQYGVAAAVRRANQTAIPGQILAAPQPPSAPVPPSPSAFIAQFGPPVAYGLGSLLGFGLAKLYYAGNPLLKITTGWLGLTIVWLLFWLMKSLGQHDPRGRMVLFGYVGAQTWLLVSVLSTLHTSWWILMLCAVSSFGLVYARLRQRTRPTDFVGSQIVIVAYVVLGTLYTAWWVPLLCVAVSVGVTFARLNQPGPPDSFNDVFPL